MSLVSQSLVSIDDYSPKQWLQILQLASEFEEKPPKQALDGQVVASLFFEPSTRTRLSFESAVYKMSGDVIGFAEAGTSSTKKGETLKDTVRVISNYADLIVMRHPLEGSARLASEYAHVPVINGGDGANQHPTQTLLDMYSIQKTQGGLEELTLTFVGDLKYGRTVHSLAQAMSEFKTTFNFVAPQQLQIPPSLRQYLEQNNADFQTVENLASVIPKTDILYMTRIQKERFADPIEYEQVKDSYVLTPEILENAAQDMKIMHPLPRVNEISEEIDQDQRAYYFEQALNGIYTRQAIMAKILGAA